MRLYLPRPVRLTAINDQIFARNRFPRSVGNFKPRRVCATLESQISAAAKLGGRDREIPEHGQLAFQSD